MMLKAARYRYHETEALVILEELCEEVSLSQDYHSSQTLGICSQCKRINFIQTIRTICLLATHFSGLVAICFRLSLPI
jgi:hypothetical protein